ncbi:MAG: amino acid adenylation domain-containing protein, partial [Tumebacillaceae bacterium]
LSQGLDALAKQHGVSGSTLAHAAWALLLGVYSGEESVTYGVTSLGRPSGVTGSEEMIGRFMNTLPAAVQVDGQKQLGEFLQGLHEQYNMLMEYAYLPLAEVRSYGGVSGEQELFASSVAVYPATTQAATLQVLGAEKWARSLEQPLVIEVRLGAEWEVAFHYADGTLSTDVVARMQSHFLTVLESMVDTPDALVSELNVLPAEEREKLFVAFNRCEIAAPSLDLLAHQVIEQQVAQRPDAIAVTCGTEQVTYAELNARANRLAHWLREQGFGRDHLAALLMERSVEMLVAIVAVLKAGGAYVPLDSAHPDNRLSVVIENSHAKVIFTQDELLERGLALASEAPQKPLVFCANEASVANGVADVRTLATYSDANPTFVNEPQDLANVFFTSGSTGLPKGAMIEHIGMMNHLYAKINLLGLNEQSIVVQNASHCFDISVWQFLAPLMVGGQVAIYVNDVAIDPQALFTSVQRDQATVLEMVPAMIEMFLLAASERTAEEQALPALEYMVSTGEGLPVALMHKWLQTYPQVKVVNTYGATECSDDTSHKVIDASHDENDNYVSLGTPIPNFKTYVLDRWQRPVPIGCAGEICLTGVGVGRGYLNDPEKTAAAFVSNPFDDGMGARMYRTGDLGRYLPNGDLVFISRIDHQVKVRGHRIELGEIESVLLKHAPVSQCVAIVRADSAGQNRILTYVVGEGLDVASLRDLIHEHLPEYMVPEHIIRLDAMPLNRNGKVDRKALPDPDDSTRSEAEFTAPRNALETALSRIWEEVLEVGQLGIDDNFFALGGHSLKTIQIRSRIKQRFGLDVPLRVLFDSQTIRDLAPIITQLQSESTDGEHQMIPRLPEAEFYPMSNQQRRLFFLHKLEPQSCAYNMPVVYQVDGDLNVDALHRAFQTIVDRHTALRTTFHLVDGQPLQRVEREYTLACPLTDLSALEESVREQQLEARIESEVNAPFDLTTGPVFRVSVLKLATNQHALFVNMHHIVSDGWSWSVLLKEFHALYNAYNRGEATDLPPLSIQYTDYSAWQNGRLENGALAEAEAYWLEKLSGELPVLELPLDHPRPPIRQAKGRHEKVAYD